MKRLCLSFVCLLACSGRPPEADAAALAPPSAPDAEPTLLLATEGPWLQKLYDAQGHLVADVSPPLGATDPRPVVVALHGGGDAPAFACGEWRGTFGPWPFIVCPYGVKVAKDLYGWGAGSQAREAAERALTAFVARYPDHADLRDPVLTGFSRGAMVAPAALATSGRVFPAAILVEGHTKDFESLARAAAKGGLTRLLFVDSQAGNAARAKADVAVFRRIDGVEARSVYVGPLGHGFFPKTAEGVRSGLAELLHDLPGWSRYPYPPIEPN